MAGKASIKKMYRLFYEYIDDILEWQQHTKKVQKKGAAEYVICM